MRRSLLLSSLALTACGPSAGGVEARWIGEEGEMEISVPATAGWCQSERTIFLEGSDGGTAVGVLWRYDSLRADSTLLRLPATGDSAPAGASAALRYFALDEVRGFQSLTGTLHITEVDLPVISARLSADMRRPGRTDSTPLTAEFRRVRLVNDSMVCTR